MSSDPTQQSQTSQSDPQTEQARRQVNQLAEEIAQLTEADIAPAQYYSELLQRLYFAMQAFGAAVWIRTSQGNLQLQCQINLREIGLDRTPDSKPVHDELLRQAIIQSKGGIIRPHFSHDFGGGGQIAGNPTDFVILLAPIMQEKQVIGLIEIWQDPNRAANVLQSLHQFLVRMAAFVSLFNRNYQLRQMLGQQELWLKLENFSRQVHASLNITEVAYLVANEGRRLVDVDRISVATRVSGSKCEVSAISGADVVEKRSNLVQLMRNLFEAVIEWGEKLVYTGTKDDTLPPAVLEALDGYLGESNSKILVVMPLLDDREKEAQRKGRSALMMECFETNLQPEQLLARLEVVGRHASSALYNAQEYRRIPMRFLWLPLAYVQDGLGGQKKAITSLILAGVTMLILAMIFVPFPHKMEAKGSVLPRDRIWLFSSIAGKVEGITPGMKSGSRVAKGQPILKLSDADLAEKITKLQTEIETLQARINPAQKIGGEGDRTDAAQVFEAKNQLNAAIKNLQLLLGRTNANPLEPGSFTIASPKSGLILSADFRELVGRNIKPVDPLVRIGFISPDEPQLAEWELELKIPQKHFGQVTHGFERAAVKDELRVDVLFVAEPTRSFQARLRRDKVARQANIPKDEGADAEPVVLAWARVEAIYTLTDDVLTSLKSPLPEWVVTRLAALKDKEHPSKEVFLRELERVLVKEELNRFDKLGIEKYHQTLQEEKAPDAFIKKITAAREKNVDRQDVQQILTSEIYDRYHYYALDYACRNDIPLSEQIPPHLLLSGGEVHTRIRCGNRAMGYSLFYGVYEFAYEKLIFPYGWR